MKRGRKPKNRYGIVPKNTPTTIKTENDNLILHLPISSKSVEEQYNYMEYTPIINEPAGYDEDKLSNCYETFKTDESQSKLTEKGPGPGLGLRLELELEPEPELEPESKIKENFPKQSHSIADLKIKRKTEFETYKIDNSLHHTMIPFYEANNNDTYPNSTNIVCFWCTEKFKCRPISLPIKLSNGIFYVDGCFCSPECAAAYNFDDTNNSDIWNRYSLLNLLYIIMIGDNQIEIKLAPPRRALKKFGGMLTIEEFRKFNENYYKQYNIIYPPMISVIPDIEKMDINKTLDKTYDYIPIDKDRIQKVSETLILKRTKPINQYKNTLENCMKLKYITI